MKPRCSSPLFLYAMVMAVFALWSGPAAHGQTPPTCTAANLPTGESAWLPGPGTVVSVVDVASVLATGSGGTTFPPVCQIPVISTPVNEGANYPTIASTVTFDAAGKYAYVVDENFGSLWKILATDGSAVSTGPFYNPLGVATTGIVVCPDQTQVYIASNNLVQNDANPVTSVLAMNASTGLEIAPLNVDSLTITGITSSTVDGHVYVSTPTTLFQITPGSTPAIDQGTPISSTVYSTGQALVASPDGKTVYVLGQTQITPFDVASHTAGTPVALPTTDASKVNAFAITKDGSTLYIGDFGTSQVYVYNVSSNTFGTPITTAAPPVYLAVSPDNSVAYILGKGAAATTLLVTLVNPATQTVIETASEPSASGQPFGQAVTGFKSVTTALSITTASLPNAQVGVAYSQTLVATGGTTPYSWSISGALPAGLSLNAATGVISGTPTTPTQGGSTASFTAQVTDSETPAVSVTAPLYITVSGNPATLIVLPQPTTVGYGTSVCFYAQDSNGDSIPATFAVVPATGAGAITPTASAQLCPPGKQPGAGAGASYQAPASPPSGTTSQSVTVTATPLSGTCANSTSNCSVSFTLTGTNGLTACCSLPQQLTVGVGGTAKTGAQLNGVPATSTVPFALSCVGLPVGSGCIFTQGKTANASCPTVGATISSISGACPTAICTLFTTGSTAAMNRFFNPRPFFSPSLYPILTLLIGGLALLFSLSLQRKPLAQRRVLYASAAILVIVCLSVSMLGACTGFSPTSVVPPSAQVTPAGTYQLKILAIPASNSGYTQTQLIVPLTITTP